MKIKKVLFICSIYYPNIGGVESVINELTQYYKTKNIESIILTKKYPKDLNEFEKINNINVVRINRPKNYKEFTEIFKLLKQYENILKPDIIHIIGVRRPMTLIGLFLSKIWKVPLLINFSGGDLYDIKDPESVKIWRQSKHLIINTVNQSDGLAAFSKGIINEAREVIPKIKRINLIYAGIDYSKIQKINAINLNTEYFVSVRRLYYSKGIDVLLKAFKKISDKYPNITLEIVGDGPERSRLEKLAKDLNLFESINFWGSKDLDFSIGLMKSSIASICPSRSEGGGLVNIEAQAARTLAIGSDSGGIPEYIINNKTGKIFKNEDVNELARLMELSITNKKLRDKIIKNAYKSSKMFDWKYISQNYIKLYNELIKDYSYIEFDPWNKYIDNLFKKFNQIWK